MDHNAVFYSRSTDLPVLRTRSETEKAPDRWFEINSGALLWDTSTLPETQRCSAGRRSHAPIFKGHGPATISPCTITMDLDAITIMTEREVQMQMFTSSVGSQKYPSRDVIYL